jgi:uncharacterized protein
MATNYLTPGVYVQEVPSGIRSISGAPTGVTAFVGAARKGATYRAVVVTSLADFVNRFGALHSDLELGYAIGLFFANGGKLARVVRVAREATLAQWRQGLAALAPAGDFDLLVLPGLDNAAVAGEALACAQSRRAMLLLDSPRDAGSVALMQKAAAGLPESHDAAVYFPWVEIRDPARRGAVRLTAPAAAVAGVIARIDAQRGVWKAPAGTEATLGNVAKLEVPVTNQDNEVLNALAINCLREFPGKGLMVFGARTRAGANIGGSEWKYVPVRRLALFIERSVERGLAWVVFEPNDEPLWAGIRQSVEGFLHGLFRAGAFHGTSAKDAYFVKCDRSTMTAADLRAGNVNVLIGFAPLKPAEFVIVKLVLKTQA